MAFLSGSSQQSNYPIVAVRDGIVFPFTENVLIFGRAKSVEAMNAANARDKKVVLVMQKDINNDDPSFEELYEYGVLAQIDKVATGEKGQMNALVKGLEKVKITRMTQDNPFFEGQIEIIQDLAPETEEVLAMVKHISTNIKKAINLGKTVDFVFLMNILNINSALNFSYQVAMILDLKTEERQDLLEESDIAKRLAKEVEYINREIKVLEIEQNISSKTQQKFEKNMKETFLREKMKTIEEELGSKEGDEKDVDDLKEKIAKANMPKEVEQKALKELKRLAQMSQFNPESSYVRTYLDWLVEVPWQSAKDEDINIQKAEDTLHEDHFGLKKVKERILEFLSVMELKHIKEQKEAEKEKVAKQAEATSQVSTEEAQTAETSATSAAPEKKEEVVVEEQEKRRKEQQPSILCFVGPPGVGKTSLGKSIARALNRKFVKVSLGGIRDEAEIRGHRRTYVGAMPGRMIQAIKQAGTTNPVFMLDEIDKIGRDYRGDPSAAMLEALDPEQNHAFSDHYLEVPYDLSNVFFITTANMLDTIPEALLDRLEVIHFAGYTEDEKFNIAKNYIVRKQREAHNLDTEEADITDEALRMLIRRYTREAGVRELERQIATVFRKVAREIVEKKFEKISVGVSDIQKYLGPYKYSAQMIEEKDTVGISTGMAWTQAGGDILFIEVAIMPGKGNLTLTGQLGDVMKESCQAALSYVRSKWEMFGLDKDFFNDIDIHVHVPEGAVPKDGPSAGCAITTAMVSALTKIPVRRDVAMTGEITLRGRVTEIGGLKEKTIAAHRAQIKTVIIPKENEKDLEDVTEVAKKELNWIFAEHIDTVLENALAFPGKKMEFKKVKELVVSKKEPKKVAQVN